MRLEEAERKMLLFDRDDRLVLTADLGVDLPQDLHPYSCIPTLSDQVSIYIFTYHVHRSIYLFINLSVFNLSISLLTYLVYRSIDLFINISVLSTYLSLSLSITSINLI